MPKDTIEAADHILKRYKELCREAKIVYGPPGMLVALKREILEQLEEVKANNIPYYRPRYLSLDDYQEDT